MLEFPIALEFLRIVFLNSYCMLILAGEELGSQNLLDSGIPEIPSENCIHSQI